MSSLDQPPLCVETPADEHNPRRYAIYGGQSGWLLHRCDVLDLSEPERSEAKAPVGVR